MFDRGWDYDVAISYARANRDLAEDFCRLLRARGMRVFFDRSVGDSAELAGHPIPEALRDVFARRALLVLPLVSRDYLSSPWCRAELEAARQRSMATDGDVSLVYVRTDDVPVAEFCGDIGCLDLRAESLAGIAEVISRVRRNRLIRLCERHHEIGWIAYLSVTTLILSPSRMLFGWYQNEFTIGHVIFFVAWLLSVVIAVLAWAAPRSPVQSPRRRRLLYPALFVSFVFESQVLMLAWTMLVPNWGTEGEASIIGLSWSAVCLTFAAAGLVFYDLVGIGDRLAVSVGVVQLLWMLLVGLVACEIIVFLGGYGKSQGFRVLLGFVLASAGLYYLWRPRVLAPSMKV